MKKAIEMMSRITAFASRFVRPPRRTAFIAKMAWKFAPKGESEFAGKRVNKRENMLLVTTRLYDVVGGYKSDILAFPKPEHFKILELASSKLVPGGPASENPNAIGSIRFVTNHAGDIKVTYVQFHYKVGDNPLMPQSFHEDHKEWRIESLKALIGLAKRNRKNIGISKEIFMRYDEKTKEETAFDPKAFKEELAKVCEELGVEKGEKDGTITIFTGDEN